MDKQQATDRGQRDFIDERMKLALEVAQLGFWDHDIANNSIFRSPEWGQMLGYSEEEVANNLNFWIEHVHPDDRPAVDRSIHDHELGIQNSFRIEHRLRTRDGGWKWVLNWGRVVERDENGRPLRALGFHLDITDRKDAEAALARVDKMSTIGTLAGGIAHDFNNLLTVIQGNLQLAATEKDEKALRGYLASAEKAVRRSQELTDRLLTFSRGGAPTLEPLDVEQVIIESRNLVLSRSSCRLCIDCMPGLPLVAGSRGHLGQVFQNLLLNARQAMPEGGTISVTCRTHRLDIPIQDLLDTGEFVEVIVQDEGPGIPDEIVEKVFDPFFTTQAKGKGLGLAAAHSIVHDHSGLLEVVRGVRGGARLRILLPVAEESEPAVSQESFEASPPASGRILVVDDDEMVRSLAVAVIRGQGYTAVAVEDGAEAVEVYRKAFGTGDAFSAVLMDLTIPGGMGGQEAVRRILEIDPDVRAVVSSGYSDDQVMANYREYGFCERLSKPYEVKDMARVLAEVVGSRAPDAAPEQ